MNLENQETAEVKSEWSEMGVLRYGSEAWKLLRGVAAIYKVVQSPILHNMYILK